MDNVLQPSSMRIWTETLGGYTFDPEGGIVFDDAVNAYIGQVINEGGLYRDLKYASYLGPEGIPIHTACVVYACDHRVSYQQAMENLLDDREDYVASIGFVMEDADEVYDTLENSDDA